MDPADLLALLEAVLAGSVSPAEAQRRIRSPEVRWDGARARRRGFAETVLGTGKTPTQILAALAAAGDGPILVTRVPPEQAREVQRVRPQVAYHPEARALVAGTLPAARPGAPVAVVTAGTADAPVAQEAVLTLAVSGIPVSLDQDVGVAGLDRLLAVVPRLRTAAAVVAVAGMEGTLPGVLAGLLPVPVIGVPTSVGPGLQGAGLVPLLAMLNACSEGLAVVNVDNGFGAARLAQLIWQQAHGRPEAQEGDETLDAL